MWWYLVQFGVCTHRSCTPFGVAHTRTRVHTHTGAAAAQPHPQAGSDPADAAFGAFPPPPPSSTPRPIYAGIAGASVLHAMEIWGEKGGKSGCGGTHPSPFLLCAAQLDYFSFSSPPGQSPAISSTEAFKSFKLGGVWVKNV